MDGKILSKPLKICQCDTIKFDLERTLDRLMLVQVFLNSLRLFHLIYLHHLFPKFPLRLRPNKYEKTKNHSNVYMKYVDNKKTGDVTIFKKIEEFSSYDLAKYLDLLEIYKLIESGKIVHTYKDFKYTCKNK